MHVRKSEQVSMYVREHDTARKTHPVRTTTKSMTFQPLRRYEPLWKANPSARILMPASKQKMAMK